MSSPGIILTTQFTTPNAKSFTSYLKYITREEALLKKNERSIQEEMELSKIQKHLDQHPMEEGNTYNSLKKKKELSETETEISGLLNRESIDEQDFTKYVSYMTRKYALEKKSSLTSFEEKELKRINHSLNEFETDEIPAEDTPLSGVFTDKQNHIFDDDLKEISKEFSSGQKRGSIIFQDVISHDNAFLEELGLYDSKTDTLDERGLIHASRAMMKELMEKENLSDSAQWMASIHRNTKHIHIHFALVENRNTRDEKVVKINGEEFVQPKGVRKQSTLDAMKQAYGRELRDYALGNERVKKLERKSELRNEIVQEVKLETNYSKKELRLLNEIYQELPEEKKRWVYGDKDKTKLSPELREKIDTLTESLMSESKAYKEYLALIKEEQRMKTRMFGQTTREDKDQLTNELFTIKKRLGNSLLTELRSQDSELNQRREKIYGAFEQKEAKDSFQEKNDNGYSKSTDTKQEEKYKKQKNTFQEQRQPYGAKHTGDFRKEPFSKGNQFYKAQTFSRNQEYNNRDRKQYKRPILSQKNLYRIKRSLDTHTDKYKELREYEQMKQRIRWEQERR
ncbi:MobP2 family relaxase [Enterococcus faecalis]|uniref:MobP2 family relaxase n=1 Tax=Enterococcus faecalis TaxID=1351 RepID=UPI00259648D8|nr:MobP2 family relaxase [Enterococcus faecalis]MDM3980330.1 MobP2 family relaxase [Enterococcus faecalis]